MMYISWKPADQDSPETDVEKTEIKKISKFQWGSLPWQQWTIHPDGNVFSTTSIKVRSLEEGSTELVSMEHLVVTSGMRCEIVVPSGTLLLENREE